MLSARVPRTMTAPGCRATPALAAYFPDQVPPPVAVDSSPVSAPDTFLTSVGPCEPGRTRTNSIPMMMIPVR